MATAVEVPPGRAIIVGLGNPGSKYAETRHNIGFRVVECLARRHGISLTEQRFKSRLGSGNIAGRAVMLLQPQTFMNLSGEAVQPAAAFYRLAPESVVVIHDELDLAVGKLRLKIGGGHAGHNGLRSMDQQLASKDYFRVRLGIARPPVAGGDVSNWVLGGFPTAERAEVERSIEEAADAVECLLREGLIAAQGRFHAGEKPNSGR